MSEQDNISMMSQSSATQQKHSDVPIPRMTGHMKEAPPAQESPPDKEPPIDDENTTKIADNDTDLQAQAGPVVVSHDVRSTAVVKYDSIDLPVPFTKLRENTNLNEPPANWLHSGSKWENYLQEACLTKDNPFASFKMAHCFPDLTGEIDAISDAENIKKLLKIPYTKSPVSMMVHRVGNTLLLDDFDTHKHLLRRQQEDWTWLRRFYYDTILQHDNKDKVIMKKDKSRDNLQNRNMFSKFLYYSLADTEPSESDAAHGDGGTRRVRRNSAPDSAVQPDEYQRTVVWSFEDLRMLIGTDLPIFGGGTHPCISLRLRDMCKPINVLTGLDYWLDNLMCNVPELAMCYHLNGIVQSYELIKTEEIPNMKDSKFSPTVVKDVAQNILSFLRSNATKEGHTYWLFKGQEDDIVKLYDLTTLCSDYMDDRSNNPFTVPVGILLYRVARNMRQTSGRNKATVIRKLLQNSLLLLDEEKHSQVVTSANFLLSDLYVSDDIYTPMTNASVESESESSEEEEEEEGEEGEEGEEEEEEEEKETSQPEPEEDVPQSSSSVEVQALCLPQRVKAPAMPASQYPPISCNREERCRQAFKHVANGLRCLDLSAQQHTDGPPSPRGSNKHTVEDQATCTPGVAIPLHYTHPGTNQLQRCHTPPYTDGDYSSSPQEVSLLNLNSALPSGTWHKLSKTLLLRKAAITYHVVAESRLAIGKYGHVLKYARLGLHCFGAMQALSASKARENGHVLAGLLGLCGDVHLLLAQNPMQREAYQEDAETLHQDNATILESCREEVKEFEFGWLNNFPADVEQSITRSALCYELALSWSKEALVPKDRRTSLYKRHGNVQNEIAVFYMNQAAGKINAAQGESWVKEARSTCEKSAHCLETGLNSFELLGDKMNQALLYSNKGRLMRVFAQLESLAGVGKKQEFGGQQRFYLKKAVESYQQALALLEKPDEGSDIGTSISWELSSTYFTMATQLQDHAPLDVLPQEQVEKEVTELMMKALKYCASDVNSPRQATCQYRAATIHHRLASLYHNSYRIQVSEQKKKHMRTLADLHYGRAHKYFWLTESHSELLRVQLERFAMGEFQLQSVNSPTSRVKLLLWAWHQLKECLPALRAIVAYLTSSEVQECSSEELAGYQEEIQKLVTILESRLNFTLQQLVKSSASIAKKGKSCDQIPPGGYKEIYSAVLKKQQPKKSDDLTAKCSKLCDILQLVSEKMPQSSDSSQS